MLSFLKQLILRGDKPVGLFSWDSTLVRPWQQTSQLLASLMFFLGGTISIGCNSLTPQPSGSHAIHYTSVVEGEVWFRHSQIQLRFDRELYCGIFFKRNGRLLSLCHNPSDPSLAKPSHFISVEGEEVLDFYIDYQNIGLSEVRTRFGAGKRLHLTGYGKTSGNTLVEKTVLVELYQDYPDIAILWAIYRNNDPKQSIRVTKVTNQFFRMDASLTDPEVPRHAIQCYYNGHVIYGQNSKPWLDRDFHRTIEAVSPKCVLVATWNRVMGMTIGTLPTNSQRMMIPVQVARDQRVEVSLEYKVSKVLAPNEALISPKGFIIVHSGDYRSALARQTEMMDQKK